MGGDAPADGSAAAARAALGELYAWVDQEVARLSPRCEWSGRCCDFPTSGLRLYATELEVDWLRRHAAPGAQAREDWCPHYVGGRCEARAGRPLGCRVYFCDESRARALEDLSAEAHARLRAIHREHQVPYSYGPFLDRAGDHRRRPETLR